MEEEHITNDFVRNALQDQKVEQGNTQRNRDEFAAGSKIGARVHEKIHGEVVDKSKVEARKSE